MVIFVKKYDLVDKTAMVKSITDDLKESMPHGSPSFPCVSYLDTYTEPSDSYPWHWHNEFEIAYITGGSVNVSISGFHQLLSKGEGFFINSRVLHSYSGGGKGLSLMPNILFLPSLIYGTQENLYWEKYVAPLLLSNSTPYVVLKPQVDWQAKILSLAEKAFSAMTREEYGYELYTRSFLSEIILILSQNLSESSHGNIQLKAETERVRRMMIFIQSNYMNLIHLRQIAGYANISPRECIRCFQKTIGMSPIQYVIEMRVRKAKELLTETNLPLLSICAMCGFQDQSYFIKTFKQRVGVTPARYRKNI